MLNPASRKVLGNDRSTSETGHGSDEAMGGAQFRNVVGFLGRPTTTDRRVDAMGQYEKYVFARRMCLSARQKETIWSPNHLQASWGKS
jgi:hypothetical protein